MFEVGGGIDRVLDFAQGEDRLDLTDFGVSSVADIQANADSISDNGNLQITFGSDVVQINNLDFVDLTDGDLL